MWIKQTDLSGFARAALITDVGVALATELETAGQKWSLGFTPKFQRVDLFNYNVLVKTMTAAHSKVTVTTTPKMALTPISVPAWTG